MPFEKAGKSSRVRPQCTPATPMTAHRRDGHPAILLCCTLYDKVHYELQVKRKPDLRRSRLLVQTVNVLGLLVPLRGADMHGGHGDRHDTTLTPLSRESSSCEALALQPRILALA